MTAEKQRPLRMFKNKIWHVTLGWLLKVRRPAIFCACLYIVLFRICFSLPPPLPTPHPASPSPRSLCDPYHCSPEREERWQTNLFIICRFSWLNCYPSWTLETFPSGLLFTAASSKFTPAVCFMKCPWRVRKVDRGLMSAYFPVLHLYCDVWLNTAPVRALLLQFFTCRHCFIPPKFRHTASSYY